MARTPKFTVLMQEVCRIVDRAPGSEVLVYETIEGFQNAISGMSRLPEEVTDKMWDLLLTFFRKILTASVMGKMDERAREYMEQIKAGFSGNLKREVERRNG